MLKDGKFVCDNCEQNPPQYSSGGMELCSECASSVGWDDLWEEQHDW
ncbi:hypothetical protein H1164_15680 [Thermoactinomyces daqus]|uniref:Uncharacterized protein n=1 Tax=Thermoactinomyces daqus TaxID=1329516 RepID=A0A7W1XCW4_9BACL|nr:hypothetical protein [Thermoactinomyces daqus]MBA4544293.1 hypothetical protein [Thermoactinomyces daqus]